MNDYEVNAEKFLEKTQTKISVSFAGYVKNNMWHDKEARNCYSVTLSNSKHVFSFVFWDSIQNTTDSRKKFSKYISTPSLQTRALLEGYDIKSDDDFYEKLIPKPTAYDILSCLTSYNPGSIDDFVSEFCFDMKEYKFTEVSEIYNAVMHEYNNLCKLFTDKEMEELQEIR